VNELGEGNDDQMSATADGERLKSVLALLPQCSYLLTAKNGARSNGVLVQFVQQCANEPPLLAAATRKGQVLSPIIRDSRRFALAMINDQTRGFARRFKPRDPNNAEQEINDNPFMGLPTTETPNGIPILAGTDLWFECTLSRHIDIDADCELYIGIVRHAFVSAEFHNSLADDADTVPASASLLAHVGNRFAALKQSG
jgi:flavin reductase (DIM6/NTAB) family NADH-FMN oxidoreductase RutF